MNDDNAVDVEASAEPVVETAAARKLYKAGELSRRTGMTRQALHQYVLMGLLEPDEVTKGGQRLFSEIAEAKVKLIRDLCGQGYTLKDVKDIFIQPRD